MVSYSLIENKGGTNMNRETQMLKAGVDLLIATPGRLVDHLETAPINFLSKVSVFILDECDRLLDMGFSKRFISLVIIRVVLTKSRMRFRLHRVSPLCVLLQLHQVSCQLS
jgi:ATP-dependent RNA helicase RhlE